MKSHPAGKVLSNGWIGPALSALLMVVTAVACTGSGEQSLVRELRTSSAPAGALRLHTSGRPGGSLRYALAGSPSTFNPTAAADARSKLIVYLTQATLLEFDPGEQQVKDGITVSHEFSADGRSLRLKFRQGLRFSDGVRFEVEDVLFTFDKIYQEGSANVLKDTLRFEGKELLVEKTASDEVLITFPVPYAAAEFILATVPVLPRHLFSDPAKKIEEYWGLDADPSEIAGLGPFRISTHEPAERVTLHANPYYWKTDSLGHTLPYLEEMIVEYIPDRNNQLLRLQSSQLDLIDTLFRPEDLTLLQDNPDLKIINAGASGNVMFLWFNQNTGKNQNDQPFLEGARREWFTSSEFRRAVSAAINRQEISRNVFLGQASLTFSLLPPGIRQWQASGLDTTDGDPESAEAILKEAGFRWREDSQRRQLLDPKGRPVQFELLTRSDEVMSRVAAMIQQDLEEIGMKVSLRQEEMRSVISRVTGSRQYDGVLLSLEFPFDPADYLNVFLSSGAMHMWNPLQERPATEWEARVDQLMLEQTRVMDPRLRFELFAEVQQIFSRQKPVIPLLSRDILVAYRSKLKNMKPANLFPYGLWNIWELSWQ